MPRRRASGHVVFTGGGIRRRYAPMDKDETPNIRIADNSLNSESFFEKNFRGPVQHWNLNSICCSRIYLWN